MGRRRKITICALIAGFALAGCGGDDAPNTDGDLSAAELAAKLPEAEFAQVTAVDVVAAKEAAGIPADTDPIDPATTPGAVRFFFSAFFAFRSVAALVENPVRDAFDHSLITAYAGHAALADDSVTLVSTSQDFEKIASSLEEADWKRDGDVLSIGGDPLEITYTAVGAGDGFVVLGYDPEVVGAVASGEAEPSETGELERLAELEQAPVTYTAVPGENGFEGGETLECVESVTFTDSVDGSSTFEIEVPDADESKLPSGFERDAPDVGFTVESIEADGDFLTIELQALEEEGRENSPALLFLVYTDKTGTNELLYDCG